MLMVVVVERLDIHWITKYKAINDLTKEEHLIYNNRSNNNL